METPLTFIAGRGTRFEIDGPDVIISRDDLPVSKIPFVDLLEFANNHPLRPKENLLFSTAQNTAI